MSLSAHFGGGGGGVILISGMSQLDEKSPSIDWVPQQGQTSTSLTCHLIDLEGGGGVTEGGGGVHIQHELQT